MTELTFIGTRLLGDGGARRGPDGVALERAVVPSEEGTLLAIVPIPGSGTSLAIVGYAVPTEPTASAASAEPRAAADPDGAGGLRLDHEQRRVWVQGTEIPLTFQEFELLAFLADRPSRVFTRTELLDRVWQRDLGVTTRTVDVHVSRLRQKLGEDYGKCLVTEYRVGYQFRPR
jgi:DNA-binding response OmpR family regulator